MGLHSPARQHAPQQMLIDLPQTADPNLLAKLMEHPRRGQRAPQQTKPAPPGLFGQLRQQKVERMGGGEQRQ